MYTCYDDCVYYDHLYCSKIILKDNGNYLRSMGAICH